MQKVYICYPQRGAPENFYWWMEQLEARLEAKGFQRSDAERCNMGLVVCYQNFEGLLEQIHEMLERGVPVLAVAHPERLRLKFAREIEEIDHPLFAFAKYQLPSNLAREIPSAFLEQVVALMRESTLKASRDIIRPN